MGRICCVCNRSQAHTPSDETVSFHSFPLLYAQQEQWLDAIPNSVNLELKRNYVCSNHFKPRDFKLGKNGLNYLTKSAIPSIFEIELESQNVDKTDTTDFVFVEITDPNVNKRKLPDFDSDTESGSDKDKPHDKEFPGSRKLWEGTLTGSSASDPLSLKLIRKRIRHQNSCSCRDIDSSDLTSPEKEKKKVESSVTRATIQKKKLKVLQQQNRRLKSRVSKLSKVVKHLQDKQLVTENSALLMASQPPLAQEVIGKILSGQKMVTCSPLLKEFALKLNFYSQKAYEHVRTQFLNVLPHGKTISRWLKNINGQPDLASVSDD